MAKATRKSAVDPTRLGGLEPARGRRVRAPGEHRVLRAVDEIRRDLRRAGDAEKAIRVAARNAGAFFQADDHCCAVVTPGVAAADLVSFTGSAATWDTALLGAFARGEKRPAPANLALARLRRRDRPWGVVAIRWDHAEVDWGVRDALRQFAKAVNDVIAEIDRDRIAEVRARIDRKVMEQLRPRDLFYQVLDGLRSLTRYDHSASLLIGDGDEPTMEIVAEKLAWRRGKSQRVHRRVPMTADEFAGLLERGVTGVRRDADDRFVAWDGGPVDAWVETLTSVPGSRSDQEPPVGEMLVAPLATRDGLRAVLVVGAVHPQTLGPHESDLLTSFLPQVSVALQNSQRAEALEARMLETERKHAMADLARGVAHDVNNALGSVVPLLQQLRAEAAEGRLDPATIAQDLEQIDQSVRVCRDIFGGMLRFARTAARPVGSGDLRSAVEMCLLILGDNLQRHRVRVDADLPAELPRVGISQSELEQLVLNLVTNARDAMSSGGGMSLAARCDGDAVELVVADEGCGIAEEILSRVQDPFFTTKMAGNGLGLSICRSIVWRGNGEMQIESAAGQGTRVTLRLPATDAGETADGTETASDP
ncbi:MAG: sensor histidine kinase [Planctomycetota bacterium]|jgi:signal transduction histidine kinase